MVEKKLKVSVSRPNRMSLVEREESELALSTQASLLQVSRLSLYYQPQYTRVVEAVGSKVSRDGKGRALGNIFTERLWRSTKFWKTVENYVLVVE